MFNTIARAIAASAAARTITKSAIICPLNPKFPNLAKATKLMFAELRINSIPIKTITAFFLVTIP